MNLLTHLGLGDHLITYGMVRELALSHDKINLFCKAHNLESLRSLYSGTNIIPIQIADEPEAFSIMSNDSFNSLKIGFTSREETEVDFGKSFYEEANVSWECRNKYQIGKSEDQLWIEKIFIHDTDEYPINKEGFHPSFKLSQDITRYCELIENAEEVHVIESSFKQLIEFLKPKGKLFLHKFENKSFRVVPSKHNWIVV